MRVKTPSFFTRLAWVNSETNLYGLSKANDDLSGYLKQNNWKAVWFEDNLTAHKTERVQAYWAEHMTHFHPPCYYPTDTTEFSQPVDRHIVLQYQAGTAGGGGVRAAFLLNTKQLWTKDNSGERWWE